MNTDRSNQNNIYKHTFNEDTSNMEVGKQEN